MSYDKNSAAAKPHSLSISERERMSISGVQDVSGFDENIVILSTSRGELSVRGEQLHIDMIDLEQGRLEVQGRIQELRYDEPSRASTLWSRLFG